MNGGTPIMSASDHFTEFELYVNPEFLGDSLGLQGNEWDHVYAYESVAFMNSNDNEQSMTWGLENQTNMSIAPQNSAEIMDNWAELLPGGPPPQLEDPLSGIPNILLESFPMPDPLSMDSSFQDFSHMPDYSQPGPISSVSSMASSSAKSSPPSKLLYICDICAKKFGQRGILRRHKKQHTKPEQCPTCPLRCAEKRDLERHKRACHSAVKKNFKCERRGCGEMFGRKDNLLRHEKSMHSRLIP